MCPLYLLDTLRNLFENGGKSSKLILLGIILILLSNYVSSSTSIHYQGLEASVVFLWFGILSLAFGFFLLQIQAYEEIKQNTPNSNRKRKKR